MGDPQVYLWLLWVFSQHHPAAHPPVLYYFTTTSSIRNTVTYYLQVEDNKRSSSGTSTRTRGSTKGRRRWRYDMQKRVGKGERGMARVSPAYKWERTMGRGIYMMFVCQCQYEGMAKGWRKERETATQKVFIYILLWDRGNLSQSYCLNHSGTYQHHSCIVLLALITLSHNRATIRYVYCVGLAIIPNTEADVILDMEYMTYDTC